MKNARFSSAASVFAVFMLLAGAALAQPLPDDEQRHLRKVLSEATSSPQDMIYALESHLAKYPDSARKSDLLRGLAKAAIQVKDEKRIIKYGEAVLLTEPSDVAMLEAVCRALVNQGDAESARRAMEWARQYESVIREGAKEVLPSASDRAQRKEEVDRYLSRALLYQAIATGTLGDNKAAADLARKSFDTYPAGESAAELGKRLAASGQTDQAVRAYADAFTVADPQATEADRAAIRKRMGELYRQAKGSQAGLGDIVLESYDRMSELAAQRKAALRQIDPNLGLTNPMHFTLTGLDGGRLPLSSLAGKVVVMDFWATWCGPCRAQHPLYDKVKSRFKSRDDVVFLAISTDEDREAVEPFLKQQGWSKTVYFEEGLSRVLRVSSIPTTVIFAKDGSIVTRMNGFDPERFVDTLTARINEALGRRAAKESE